MTGADAVVEILEQLGIDVVFGLCGDTSLPLYSSLSGSGSIQHILTRDERGASYMADAYARLSGNVGVCEGPSGGGATYILPGVAEANDSSVPLVCLTSDIAVADRGKGTLTELDQKGIFTPITKHSFAPTKAEQLPEMIRSAFRETTTGSLGACHVSLPFNVQIEDVQVKDVYAEKRFSSYPQDRISPDPEDIARAARLLADSRHPVLIAGAGAIRSGAWKEVKLLADVLGAAVASSICGKGAIAETDPRSLGVIGSNGGRPWRHNLVHKADLILYVGSGTGSVTTDKWTLPVPGTTKIIQVDTNCDVIGRNYDVAVGIHADAKLALVALIEEISGLGVNGHGDRVDLAEIEQAKSAHMAEVSDLFESSEWPIRPERLLSELFNALPERSVIIADPGTPCPYIACYWQLAEAGRWFVSPRAFGALGYSLPGVVGAYFARPDAGRIVGMMGDGSFGISMGELETIVRLNLPVTLLVCNNASYGWIKAGQKSRGDSYFSVDFATSDHAAIARAFGMEARRIENPNELGDAMREALTAEGPYLLDVVTQPLEEANAPVSKWIA